MARGANSGPPRDDAREGAVSSQIAVVTGGHGYNLAPPCGLYGFDLVVERMLERAAHGISNKIMTATRAASPRNRRAGAGVAAKSLHR